MSEVVILALDLSLSCTGYVVGRVKDGQLIILEVGSINNKKHSKKSQAFRLHKIATKLKELYKNYPITIVVKEKGFSNERNFSTQTLFKVAGVTDLISFVFGHDEIAEIPPATVKKTVTGNGRATKGDVAEAVKKYIREMDFRGEIDFNNDNETDAVAVLIAYCLKEGLI